MPCQMKRDLKLPEVFALKVGMGKLGELAELQENLEK